MLIRRDWIGHLLWGIRFILSCNLTSKLLCSIRN